MPRLLALAAVAVLLVVAVSAAPVPTPPPIIKVRVTLDKTEATVGEAVVLEESVAAADNPLVKSMTHHAVRAGRWEPGQGLVNLPLRRFGEDFFVFDEGLPFVRGSSKPRAVPELRPGRRGESFTFKPKRVGVFLISCAWNVANQGEWQSPPVVLTVTPPLDAQGRPAPRPEHLAEDD